MPNAVTSLRQPPEHVVEALERWLTRARRGEIRALVLVGITVSDTSPEGSEYELHIAKHVWRDALAGVVSRALWAINKIVQESPSVPERVL